MKCPECGEELVDWGEDMVTGGTIWQCRQCVEYYTDPEPQALPE